MNTAPMPQEPRPDGSPGWADDPQAGISEDRSYGQGGYRQPGGYGQGGYDQGGYDPGGYGQGGYDPGGYGQGGYGQGGYDPGGYGQGGYGQGGYDPYGQYGYQPRYGPPGQQGGPPGRPSVDGWRLWSGGVATAVVSALIALVGVLVSRWLLRIPLLAPHRYGAYGSAHTTALMLGAAAAALAATGLAHLLMLGTPRPLSFLGWIIGLATVVAVVIPFSTAAPLDAKIATGVVFLVLGSAISSLISGVAARSVRNRPPGGPYQPGSYQPGQPGYYQPGQYDYERRDAPSRYR